jgi:C4-dicarboxylate transporter, DctM subunit
MNAILGVIGLAISFLLIFLRMPIAFAFGIVGFAGIVYLKGFYAAFVTLYTFPFNYMNNYVWTTIPMYLLMGYLAMQTKLTDEFYSGIRAWMGNLKGGLLYAIVLGNGAFGACCGVSIAAASAFTTISLPETRKYGYSDSLTLATIVGSSNLSIMIPPSFAFLIYGAITGTSISKLFIAGILPGLLLLIMFIVLIYFIVLRDPTLAPGGVKTSFKEKIMAGKGMWALFILFAVIIGGLYMGLFTPVEAAGVGACMVFIIGAARRKITLKGLQDSIIETLMLSSMVFFLVIGCTIFNTFLALSGGSAVLENFLASMTSSPVSFLIILSCAFLVLGAFLDVGAMTILLLPIIFPVAKKMGIDPIHLGVSLTVIMNIGTISPPFGIVTYAVMGVAPDVPVGKIFRGLFPFIGVMVILAALLIFFPEISLYLPSRMTEGG